MYVSLKEQVTSYSESMHSSLQTCAQGRGHCHRWWSPSGFRPCWLSRLGFPAARRGLCAWHCHHGEAHRQWPPHVVRGHHQWGGTGLLNIWDGVFQHSKILKREGAVVYHVSDGAGCWADPTYALGLSSFLSLAVTRCHVLLVWPCWMWLRKRISGEMPHVLENTWTICWKSRNSSIRSSVTFGKEKHRYSVRSRIQHCTKELAGLVSGHTGVWLGLNPLVLFGCHTSASSWVKHCVTPCRF